MGAAGSIEGADQSELSKEHFITRAQFSEQAERYDDMYEEMKIVVEKSTTDLKVEERIGGENERLCNKADISKLIDLGWTPQINLFEYLQSQKDLTL